MPALSSHQVSAVTDKVHRLLTLSRVLWVELDFRSLVALARYEQGPSTPVHVGRTLPVVPDDIHLAGTVGSPNFSYL